MRYLGILLLLVGLGAMYYFMFAFDTSVANSHPDSGLLGAASDRVGNLGLQNDRVCGMIAGAALTIAGAVMGGYAGVKTSPRAGDVDAL